MPIPPLPIQQEIVKILDTFQSLEAELEAELEKRKKQYEFYRDQLLTFTERESPVGDLERNRIFLRRTNWKKKRRLHQRVTQLYLL
ncbi:restriction endonuclease subunit S [Corynebacterium sp. LK24]|uniref:restriction endonuclease subunit S n=1 Tax=Corynebacterium sp. LK24 TaxID=2044583 RepID=UPI0016527D65|nr:hypothetical protein [Corynebacterium sp. LK24]